jgi:hypothetical protein
MMNQNENKKTIVLKKDVVVNDSPVNTKIEIDCQQESNEAYDDGPLQHRLKN